MNTASESIF
jgi:hypothetical protein